ncbi:NitT/TauT family transport system permease protein [Albimonas donghaensis]|uniref:NitT/TauT family transport system permease protein n=1 Tax=Albimonas donghaensis TaxID=356660 RepID=A0A1H2REE0_9RHOB|nr:ABC transporter permease [Albimonas donghaensis]SDW17812.1 NitT/TauT family transport system permease protein [Albimonas donghaensis]
MTVKDTDPTLIDAEELARQRSQRLDRTARWLLPALMLIGAVAFWQWRVEAAQIPHYILPSPTRVWAALVENAATLFDSWLITVQTTLLALIAAVIGGAGLAMIFNQSRWAEMSFYPFAVILQVTPVVAVAPLILIYVSDIDLGVFVIPEKVVGMLIVSWIVAFFPILSNSTLGLRSADHNLRDLFSIYGATRWQRLRYLQIPAALPYFLGGLRIAGGLSLIGAVVAEFVAGTGGMGSGLAFRILEANYRLKTDLAFAALILIALTGVLIFAVLSLVSHLLLRKWHESAIKREV